MIRITHPRPQLGRQSALGIDFTDGVSEVEELHPERAQALIQHGYQIEEHIVGTKLESLSVADLRDIAAIEGVDLPVKAKKAEIIALIDASGLEVMD